MASKFGPDRAIVSVTTGPEWKRVADALRIENERLADRFTAALRDEADKLASRAQAAVMRIPVHTGQHSGLRARVAKGVGTKILGTGVSITASMNDKDEINIPAYLDARDGWRHPVYGNRHNWVRQMTGGSWFRDTIARGQPEIEDRMNEIFQNAADVIAAAGAGR